MLSVSVVIPVFNQQQRIRACLDSVIAQTCPPLEVLVIDDHSSDGTRQVVERHGNPLVRLISLERNQGAQCARNRGIVEAQGNWIAFQDADDEWLPDKLQAQVEGLARFGFDPYSVVHSDAVLNDTSSGKRSLHRVRTVEGEKEHVYPSLLSAPGPLFPAMVVSKQALAMIGPLDTAVPSYQEWDTAIRLARHCRFIHIRKPLFIYNFGTGMSKDREREIEGYQYVLDKNENEIRERCGEAAWRKHLCVQATKYLYHDLHDGYQAYLNKYGITGAEERNICERAAVLSLIAREWGKARRFLNLCPRSVRVSVLRFCRIMHWRPDSLTKIRHVLRSTA